MIDKLTQEERDNALEQNVIDTIAKTKSEIRVAQTVALIALIGLVFLLGFGTMILESLSFKGTDNLVICMFSQAILFMWTSFINDGVELL